MPKKLNKPKSLYQQIRDDKGLSRDKASELLECINTERLERIETGKSDLRPEEVLIMADKYQMPDICNYYCSHDCPIGKKYVPHIEMRSLEGIVLEMLTSVNKVHQNQERLMEITFDGKISKSEIEDFIDIQEQLERISITVQSMQLWAKKKIASGTIDKEAYEEALKRRKELKEED